MATGKSIRLFLADGSPHGLIAAEIVNWTGCALVVPRAELGKLAKRDETRRPGVYLLVGSDPERLTRERVYVGESENVLARLAGHNRGNEKEFWTRTALILSKDENLTKSHIRFLESRIIADVQSAGRFVLDNPNHPEPPPLPEADQADMEQFLEQLRILLPVLGFSVMQRRATPETTTESESPDEAAPVFEMSPVGLHATMRIIGDEFVVHKGSTARKTGLPSWVSYRSLRDQLVEDGVLVDGANEDQYIFAEEYAFASPSAAASVVYGGAQSGRTAWRHRHTGQPLRDWEAAKFDDVGVGEEITTSDA